MLLWQQNARVDSSIARSLASYIVGSDRAGLFLPCLGCIITLKTKTAWATVSDGLSAKGGQADAAALVQMATQENAGNIGTMAVLQSSSQMRRARCANCFLSKAELGEGGYVGQKSVEGFPLSDRSS